MSHSNPFPAFRELDRIIRLNKLLREINSGNGSTLARTLSTAVGKEPK